MISIDNSYQTVPLPDGSTLEGMFPTVKWYKSMSKYINFKDKVILDYGSCMFGYGVQALQDGARYVWGIDNDPKRIEQSREIIKLWGVEEKTQLSSLDIETLKPELLPDHQIAIFSMIIHWLDNPEENIKKLFDVAEEKVAFIYRYRYPNKPEPGYRPKVAELCELVGRKPICVETLMCTDDQNIKLVIYDKNL